MDSKGPLVKMELPEKKVLLDLKERMEAPAIPVLMVRMVPLVKMENQVQLDL